MYSSNYSIEYVSLVVILRRENGFLFMPEHVNSYGPLQKLYPSVLIFIISLLYHIIT